MITRVVCFLAMHHPPTPTLATCSHLHPLLRHPFAASAGWTLLNSWGEDGRGKGRGRLGNWMHDSSFDALCFIPASHATSRHA